MPSINKVAPDYLPHSSMMPVVSTFNGERIPFSNLIRIDPDNLIPEYELQAPWAAAIGYSASMKEIEIERVERDIKTTEARSFIAAKKKLDDTKPVPDTLAKARSQVTAELEELYEKLFKLKEEAAALVSARISWATRKEMLISLGAETRIDKKSSSSMM